MSVTTSSTVSIPTVPRWISRIVAWLLRSPFHALLSGNMMVLTFTGRKSGRRFTFPVSYLRQGDGLIMTTHHRWWHNLRDGAPVELYLVGSKVIGHADVNTNHADVAQGISAILQHIPSNARYFGIRLDQQGQPEATDLQRAAEHCVLITINLSPSKDA